LAFAGRKDIAKDKKKTTFVRNVPFRCGTAGGNVSAHLKLTLVFLSHVHPCHHVSRWLWGTAAVGKFSSVAASCRATEDDIVEFFGQCGTVVDVVRRLNKEGGHHGAMLLMLEYGGSLASRQPARCLDLQWQELCLKHPWQLARCFPKHVRA
jgi:hypothetical protein